MCAGETLISSFYHSLYSAVREPKWMIRRHVKREFSFITEKKECNLLK